MPVTIPPWLGSLALNTLNRARKYRQAQRRATVLVHGEASFISGGATPLTAANNWSVATTGTAGTPEDSRYYFMKVTNRRDRPIEITHAWFTGAPHDALMPVSGRQLPVRLATEGTWEGCVNAAWLPTSSEKVLRSGRVLIAGRKKPIKSRPNKTVPTVGPVAQTQEV
jgi:hypothetical protein